MEYSYYLLSGNGLNSDVVMGAIDRAKRRFYLRPTYLVRHFGDIVKLAASKWSLAWQVGSRVVFGTKVANPESPARPEVRHRAA
jgi:hypothetical protein